MRGTKISRASHESEFKRSATIQDVNHAVLLPPSAFGARLALRVANHRVINACCCGPFYHAVLGMLFCGIYAALLPAPSASFGSLGADFLPSLGQALLLSSD